MEDQIQVQVNSGKFQYSQIYPIKWHKINEQAFGGQNQGKSGNFALTEVNQVSILF